MKKISTFLKMTVSFQYFKIVLFFSIFLTSSNAFGQVANNYAFSESAGTYTAITGANKAHGDPWNDAVTPNNIPLGFTFNYNGTDYSTCSINTNGYITFGTIISAATLYTPISATAGYSGAISALGIDLISGGSNITYATIGTAPNRTFIAQWKDVNRYSGGTINGLFNFQIRLSETTNDINIVYGSCSTNVNVSYNVQVGLRGAANTDFNNRSLATNVIWDNATNKGTVNTSSCPTRNDAYPNKGRTFRWYKDPNLTIAGTTAHGTTCPTLPASSQTYTITNSGPVAAAGVTVVSDNAQFVVSGLSSTTIAANGGTATYNVTFTPATAGAKTATITVASTTTGSNSPTSSLTGTGTTIVNPTTTTSAATLIGLTGATLNASAATFGVCPSTTGKGFVISQTSVNAAPIIAGTGVTNEIVTPLGTAGSFLKAVTGLVTSTQYSYRAYLYDGTTYTYGAVVTFTTLSPPTITSFTPSSVCASSSQTVVITGTGFTGVTGAAAVKIGGTNAASYVVNSITEITATIGAGTTGKITITATNGTATSLLDFTVNPLPSAIGGGASTVCTGATTAAFTNATGGGSWSTSNGNATINASGELLGVSAGTVNVIYTLPTGCSVTSGNITVTTVPATVTTPAPANNATGICYAGTGSISSILWSAISGATSYDVYFGAGTIPVTITANVLTNTYNTGVLAANTTYYWRIVDKNGCGDAVSSETWSFATSGTPCYCPSSGGNISDGITGVQFNSINNLNTPVNTGYTDYTSIKTIVMKGSSYDLNVYVDTGGNFTNYQSAYIDWNGDGDFVDAGESYNLGTANNVANGLSSLSPLSITVPAAAITGTVRMRIQSRYGNFTGNPCRTGFDGEVEDYTIKIVVSAPCTAPTTQPTGLVLTPSTGTINGSFTAAVPEPYSYLVVMNTTGIAPTPVDNTDYVIASTVLGGTNIIIDNDSDTSFTADTLEPLTTYYFFIFSNNNVCTGGTKYLTVNPLTGNATTPITTYCIPATYNNTEYIAGMASVGTLNDVSNSSGYSPGGYGDYTAIVLATQIPGNGINFNIDLSPSPPAQAQFIKVWVDWNKDGDFEDLSEDVYTTGNIATGPTSFGFIVSSTQSLGDYRMRIKTRNFGGSATYTSCNGYNRGETEDYTIRIVADCSSKITGVTNGSACGPTNTVNLSANMSAGSTEVRWYSASKGGSVLATNSGSWTTDLITVTTTYYVAAWNGSCETKYRVPVVATIFPIPAINITPSIPEVCDEDITIKLTSAGDFVTEEVISQDFESGMGPFTITTTTNTNGGPDTPWSVKASPYKPTTTNVWKPAVNSGTVGSLGNHFAFTTSDYQNSNIETRMTSPNIDVSTYTNLTLTFDHYYSYYGGDRGEIQVATNAAGDNWTSAVATYNSDLGSASAFVNAAVDLTPYAGITTLKFRFVYVAQWDDGWAVDNIKLIGVKPLPVNLAWSGATGSIFAADCTSSVPVGGSSEICIKPQVGDYETVSSWTISATSTLSTGCPATGTIIIPNNRKTWNTGNTDWATNNWKPLTSGIGSPPTASNCVIVKSPVIIGSATNALAKNIKIETTAGANGKLNIAGSLTVTDHIINTGTDAALIVESDGNLKQITDSPVPANAGLATAKRNIKFRNDTRQEYNYLISPVVGQSLKTIYPGVPTTATYPYILYHNEATNYFYNSSGAYIAGRGLAVKEPSKGDINAVNVDALFRGALANGVINYPLAFNDMVTHGYNLVGNPYASNIDLQLLYGLNTGIITSTFYFWDNGANDKYQQMGSGYSGRAYAVFNASNNTGNAAGFLLNPTQTTGNKVPNNITKVGQGFMVRSMSAGKTLVFKNSIRVTDNTNVQFFSKNADSTANRYWLRLITPANLVNTMAVVHFDQGSNTFGMDDSELNNVSSDMLYSIVEGHQVQIEGKPSFVDTDKINLGTQHYVAGNYTFALGDKEGIFDQTQNIYLKDNQTGTVTNLSEGNYTFAANSGASTGRFEIIYRPQVVLVTNTPIKDGIIVYRDQDHFVIKSPKTMMMIQVYEASGKLIAVLKPNSKQQALDVANIANGMYLLKIVTTDGEVTNKKISR